MKTEIILPERTEPPAAGSCLLKVVSKEENPSEINFDNLFIPSRNTSSRKKHNSFNTRQFRKKHFDSITDKEWNDWQWQLKNRFTSIRGLEKILELSEGEIRALDSCNLPVNVTPYYASLLSSSDSTQPLRRSVIPVVNELSIKIEEMIDSLNEDNQSPVPGVVHRYPDRVLFLVTDFCSTNCRYCTRSRVVCKGRQGNISYERWGEAIDYIAQNRQIRDVLVSGGDPLTLPDDMIEWILSRLQAIPHVDYVRIGTKVPAVLPQRITARLARMLRKYHPVWMSLHFTHPDELTPETIKACNRLADAGVPLGSQTVLLAGINDNLETLRSLFHGLIKSRVKPYYLYQCDLIPGSSHFRTPVSRGIEIIQGLRGHTSGYAVPQFVIDAPGGGGKIPVNPDYIMGRDGDFLILKNYEKRIFRYYDPH
ncbi:MAG: KamA family radical SAM protein [Vulcanimicrobiota bacterium]